MSEIKKRSTVDIIISYGKVFILSYIIIEITSSIKYISSLNYLILFLQVSGTLMVGSALSPMYLCEKSGLIERFKSYLFEYPVIGQPIKPDVIMLYIGIFFLILGSIISA